MISDLFEYISALLDKHNTIAGIALPSFAVTFAATSIIWLKTKLGSRYEAIVRISSLSIAAFAFFWVTFLAWRDQRSAFVEEANKIKSAQQEQVIALDCRIAEMPKSPPSSGSIFFMEIGLPADKRLGFAERYALPDDKPWTWPGSSRSYRCDATNLSNKPLQNVVIPLKISYRGKYSSQGPMDGPPGVDEQSILSDPEQTRWLRLPFLLTGSMFTFYVDSSDGAEAIVDLPDSAQLGLDSAALSPIKVVIGARRDLYFPSGPKRKLP